MKCGSITSSLLDFSIFFAALRSLRTQYFVRPDSLHLLPLILTPTSSLYTWPQSCVTWSAQDAHVSALIQMSLVTQDPRPGLRSDLHLLNSAKVKFVIVKMHSSPSKDVQNLFQSTVVSNCEKENWSTEHSGDRLRAFELRSSCPGSWRNRREVTLCEVSFQKRFQYFIHDLFMCSLTETWVSKPARTMVRRVSVTDYGCECVPKKVRVWALQCFIWIECFSTKRKRIGIKSTSYLLPLASKTSSTELHGKPSQAPTLPCLPCCVILACCKVGIWD